MASTQKLRNRLLRKLSELFQLNQPDLDFGFYRIMHAKAALDSGKDTGDAEAESWKVHLIEDEFMQHMWRQNQHEN